MKIISEAAVRQCVTPAAMRVAIKSAFETMAAGDSEVFPIVTGEGATPGNRVGVKSGRDDRLGLVGVKVGSYFATNKAVGLAPHASTVLLLDAHTAQPTALVCASHLNGLRTAAANALAVDALARPDAQRLAIYGAGQQAGFEIEAILGVRDIVEVLVVGRNREKTAQFVRSVAARHAVTTRAIGAADAAEQADIIVTATSARAPVLRREWVQAGTHISAMGADGPGKQELDVSLFENATVIVDIPAQALTVGECQHPFAAGLLTAEQLANATLGHLLTGAHGGRPDASRVTIFDSTGIAIQDIAAAKLALDLASAAGKTVEA